MISLLSVHAFSWFGSPFRSGVLVAYWKVNEYDGHLDHPTYGLPSSIARSHCCNCS